MTGSKSSSMASCAARAQIPETAACSSSEENLSARLAAELLDAVDGGSSAALLEVLSRITLIDVDRGRAERDSIDSMEGDRLELLRAIAVQLRLDLHAMLMHIYQRLEASRGYLDVARRLAGRPDGGEPDLSRVLPRVDGGDTRPEALKKAAAEDERSYGE